MFLSWNFRFENEAKINVLGPSKPTTLCSYPGKALHSASGLSLVSPDDIKIFSRSQKTPDWGAMNAI